MLTDQSLAPHEARHHPVPAVCLHKRWLLKEILEDGIFTLSSPFGLGKSCFTTSLQLTILQQRHLRARTYVYRILSNIQFFQWRKFWTRKFWRFCGNSPNSPKFSPSNILYRTVIIYYHDDIYQYDYHIIANITHHKCVA